MRRLPGFGGFVCADSDVRTHAGESIIGVSVAYFDGPAAWIATPLAARFQSRESAASIVTAG